MDRKVKQLQSSKTAILNFAINTRKTAKAKQTKGFLQARKELLGQYWAKFVCLHDQVVSECTPEEMEAAGIATSIDFEAVECVYAETMGELHDLLDSTNSVTDISMSQSFVPTQAVNQSLPRIRIPPFDGNFLHWFPFKDLFISIVTSNASLSNTQRLQYLKDSLTGEAKNALDNVTTTDANFQDAWELLQSKYENKRIIINAHVAAISKLPCAPKESASALRSLLDGVTSSIRALQDLGRPIEHWDDWLVFTITHKLDATTRKAWELSLKSNDDIPTFKELQEFLTSRTQSLEIVQSYTEPKPFVKGHTPKKLGTTSAVSGYHTTSGRCPNCSGKHIIMFCEAFRNKSPHERYDYALQAKLCLNCLHIGHQQAACSSERRCKTCQAKHHTMLHDYFAFNATSTSKQAASSHNAVTTRQDPNMLPSVLIGTALIEVKSKSGHKVGLRALLDSGAEATFISESAVNLLHLVKSNVKIPINGANGDRVATAKGLETFNLRSLKSDFELACIALVLPRVGNRTPTVAIAPNDVQHFSELDLADATWNVPQPIDVILNAADYAALLLSGIQRSKTSLLIGQSTRLGWVIFGSSANQSFVTTRDVIDCYHTQLDLDRTLRSFWELEELNSTPALTQDDRFVENYFNRTTRRAADGRYIVRLPVKPDSDLTQLASTHHDAIFLLDHLRRRLSRDPVMRDMYEEFINEYASLQHMVSITKEEECSTPICYLSHHGIWKTSSSTTKLRVVFNASRRCNSGYLLRAKP
ncbi:uncharacterized protein LOC118749949 [Rhagoletis pomonella]|uniref:uncharacterized protein LOC118749949 n=1 Tax=Rhagoletis pomonella TaxID=28610 RepID=UPI00178138DD|nr:uncharacterized protein LOC118749949 [Rhagoletis pomonella]